MSISYYNGIIAILIICGLSILVAYYLTWNDIFINIGLAWIVISTILFLLISFLGIKYSKISIKCVSTNCLYSFVIMLLCVICGSVVMSSVKIKFIYDEDISDSFEIVNNGVTRIIGKNGKFRKIFCSFHEGELRLNYTKDGIKNFFIISDYVTDGSVFTFALK